MWDDTEALRNAANGTGGATEPPKGAAAIYPPSEDQVEFDPLPGGLKGRVAAGKISLVEFVTQIVSTLQIRIQLGIDATFVIGGIFRGFTVNDYRWVVIIALLGIMSEIGNTTHERQADLAIELAKQNPRWYNKRVKLAKDSAAAEVSGVFLMVILIGSSLFIWP